MSATPFAKVVPYSSVVGGGITLHEGPSGGPAIVQLALLNIHPAPGEDHKAATLRIANMIADIINRHSAGAANV